MTIAFSLIAIAVLIKTVLVLADQSPAFRRCTLATCGAAQMSLGIVAAGVVAWSNPVWAADEGAFFETAATATADEPAAKTNTVSVELGKTVFIPPGRPDWIREHGKYNREPGAAWVAVESGPWQTKADCEKALSSAVKQAADEYVNFTLDSQFAAQLLQLDGAELKNRLVKNSDIYAETIQGESFGKMEQLHAHVHFTDDFRREIESSWKDLKVKWRLGQVGVVAFVLLGLLGTASGFFKANNATRGQRTSTLQFAAAATILGIVVAGVTAARYLYWF
jgi:hypothetical protein